MRELLDLSNLPTPIIRPSSFDDSMEKDVDDFLPLSHKDDAISHSFWTEQQNIMNVSVDVDTEISQRFTENGDDEGDDHSEDISQLKPQRVTPSQTNDNIAPEKRRASDTTSSSMKPPEAKKTRGLECHVKNLSLIFEAMSAS